MKSTILDKKIPPKSISLSPNKEKWSSEGSGINTGLILIEEFLLQTEELIETSSFKSFSNDPACKSLLELYNRINECYSHPDTMFNLLSKEKLLSDKKWIEIQDLSKKVKHNLELFIIKGRSDG